MAKLVRTKFEFLNILRNLNMFEISPIEILMQFYISSFTFFLLTFVDEEEYIYFP